MRPYFVLVLLAPLYAACAPAPATFATAPAPANLERPFELPRPNVIVQANPPPPFTYWAPEGSIIRNHGNPGLWVAHLDGRQVVYFGDSCHASELQGYIGQPLSSLPPAPEGMSIRVYCTTCAKTDDLRPNRINVVVDDETQRIVEIACH